MGLAMIQSVFKSLQFVTSSKGKCVAAEIIYTRYFKARKLYEKTGERTPGETKGIVQIRGSAVTGTERL